jgi:nicotinate-nucleotide adenylyltransferase
LQKIGILGGSFDPIHKGHLNIAQSAYEEFDLDEVWFIPAGHSPNKNEAGMTSAEERAYMAELAVEDIPYFSVSRIELEYSGISYTYLTLTKLKEQYPDTIFYFIMGADSLDYFEKWYHPEIICRMCIILVAVRDDMDTQQIIEKIRFLSGLFEAEIYPLHGGRTDISSTELRAELCHSCNAKHPLLPEKVSDYITEKELYRQSI